MNYEEVRNSVTEECEKSLQRLERCKKRADKIQPVLPDGWNCNFTPRFGLVVEKGRPYSTSTKEFKLVCELVRRALGIEPRAVIYPS